MRQFIHSLMTDKNQSPGAVFPKALLLFLSFFYGLGVKGVLLGHRVGVLKTHRVHKPVVSIGNLTVGGSGKTPLVEAVALEFKKRSRRPVVLIRGYMASPQSSESDEAKMLKQTIGESAVMVGKNRVQNAIEAEAHGAPDVFILDDGFQHWRLHRDLDVVAIDSTNPFGNGQLIPRGILREQKSALARADLCVLTKTDLGAANLEGLKTLIHKQNPQLPIYESCHQPETLINLLNSKEETAPAALNAKTVVSFCSIGDPQSFGATLRLLGASVRKQFIFLDHHLYSDSEILGIIDFCRAQSVETLVTTQKDAVKLTPYLEMFRSCGIKLWSLKVRFTITNNQNEFFDRICSVSGG